MGRPPGVDRTGDRFSMTALVSRALKAKDLNLRDSTTSAGTSETGYFLDDVISSEADETESTPNTDGDAPPMSDPREPSLPHDFDMDVRQLPELQRNWGGGFRDKDVEAAYREEVFYPNLGRCMSHVFAFMACFNCLSFVGLSAHGVEEGANVELHGWTANLFVVIAFIQLGFLFRSVDFCTLNKKCIEPIAVACLIVLAIFLRFHRVLIPTVACTGNAALMLRLAAFTASVAAHVPLTASAFLLICVVSVAIGAELDLHTADTAGFCAFNFGALCAHCAACTLVRYNVSMASRGEWAFRRTVLIAQYERKRVHRRFELARSARLKAQRKCEQAAALANVAKEGTMARSRLIRIVMHDLRSPLLSVLNVTKLLSSQPSKALSAMAASCDEDGDDSAKLLETLNTCTKLMENIVRARERAASRAAPRAGHPWPMPGPSTSPTQPPYSPICAPPAHAPPATARAPPIPRPAPPRPAGIRHARF